MGRRSAAEARDTRARIVSRALRIASTDGLEGVTIGRLADSLEMSKSGVLNHFRTKELLQLAVIETAGEVFRREVWEPARAEEHGLARLLAIEHRWLDLIDGPSWPGGCFWTATAAEFDDRPGPVRDALAEAMEQFDTAMRRQVGYAIDAGELPEETDPAQIVFELRGVLMVANQQLRLHNDDSAPERAHAAIRRILGAVPQPL
ncbi:MAG TPA: TetR/AcrR family transcriptional regulator [Conexibacter sp.]|jgi:AcrR family transcriptional regulator